jgi:hypothetical protein
MFETALEAMNATFKRLNIAISHIKERDDNTALMSFSHRIMRGEYCIYINKRLEKDAQELCDLREKEHILCNHLSPSDIARQQFNDFFKKNMHIIFFKLPEEKNRASRMGLYSRYIFDRFAGIAQSMEVNSKLFKDDWDNVKALLEKNIFESSLHTSNYVSYPEKNWPLELDWTSYMVLLCKNMKASMESIGSGEGKSIRSGDVTQYNAETKIEDSLKEMHQARKTIAQEFSDDSGDEKIRRGRTSHITGAASAYSICECSSLKDFLRILRERSLLAKKRRLHTDLMYNINRNKFASNVLIPRRYRIVDKTQAPVCILLDVSGSVPIAFLKRLVHTIIQAEGVFDKSKSRLVCWSDSLCSDTQLDELHDVVAGGSTILARGIEYCKKYLSENAAFFIVSDFQDDLGDWIRAAKPIVARKTAVAYADIDRRMSFERWFSMIGSNANYQKTETSIREFSAVFETVLLTQAL